MLKFNEGRVCEAIVQHLEARVGGCRTNLRWPERENHDFAVELVFDIGENTFALEHTGIEPFDNFLLGEARAKKLFPSIKAELESALPSNDAFILIFPSSALQVFKNRDIGRIQDAITAWVKKTAPTMALPTYTDCSDDKIPFALRLFRTKSYRPTGYFDIRLDSLANTESGRRKRLQKTCAEKFPKLAGWKREAGAKAILVLEDNDIQLSNHWTVAETFLNIAQGRTDTPDEVYYFFTRLETWYASPILVDGTKVFDMIGSGSWEQAVWKIDPSNLTSLTDR